MQLYLVLLTAIIVIKTTMPRYKLRTSLLCLIIPTSIWAHSNLSTNPEDGAVLAMAPEHFEFDFTKDIRLTNITLIHNSNEPIKIDIESFNDFSKQFSIPNPQHKKGSYTIEWRGLSIDGHVMQGSNHFTVK